MARKKAAKKPEPSAIRNRIKRHVTIRAGDLVPHENNFRTHPDEQRAALQGLYDEIGFARSLLAYELPDGRLKLVDGHLRQEMTPDMEVTVEVLDLNDDEAKLMLASVDPLAAMATADAGKLKELLDSFAVDNEALNAMLAGLAADAGIPTGRAADDPGGGGDDFDVAAAEEGPCRVTKGDLWLIDGGKHRLLCGDSTNTVDVARVMEGEKARLMNTDPPYGVALNLRANHEASNAAKGIEAIYREFEAIENDELTGEELQVFLEDCIRAAVPHLAKNVAFYLWHPMLTQGTFFAAAAAAADILIHRQIIWVKPHFIFGRGDYHWKHELCFYGWVKGDRPPWYGERNQDTVWVLNEGGGSIRKDQGHSTQKPLELFIRPINNHTQPGEIVYEPFAGSGSQIIAASRLSRRCFGLEIEPKYCEVILKRCEAEGLTVAKAT